MCFSLSAPSLSPPSDSSLPLAPHFSSPALWRSLFSRRSKENPQPGLARLSPERLKDPRESRNVSEIFVHLRFRSDGVHRETRVFERSFWVVWLREGFTGFCGEVRFLLSFHLISFQSKRQSEFIPQDKRTTLNHIIFKAVFKLDVSLGPFIKLRYNSVQLSLLQWAR